MALDRAFLAEPLPTDAAAFSARIDEGRARLNLIAQEVARLAGAVLAEYAAALRKLKDSRPAKDVADDIAAQLQRLVPKRFLQAAPYGAAAAPAALPEGGDAAAGQAARRPGARRRSAWPNCGRWSSATCAGWPSCKGAADARLDEYRWLLEELRVSLFAQELRTPQPVSVKRLDKAWAQLQA